MRAWFLLACLGLGCGAERAAEKGRAALEDHQLSEAEQHFRRALSLEPDHAGGLEGLGWTYLVAGEAQAAESVFDRCVRQHPTDSGCLRGRAGLALGQGDLVLARRLLRQAKEAHPDDPGVAHSLALLALGTEEPEEGVRALDQLVARHPEDARYRLSLARAQQLNGDGAAALQTIERALDLPAVPVRVEAMLWLLQSETILAVTRARVDADRCGSGAAAVRTWLEAGEQSAQYSAASRAAPPKTAGVLRAISRRKAALNELCPPSDPSTAPDSG